MMIVNITSNLDDVVPMISQYCMVFNWCAIIIFHYSTNQVSILIRLPKYMLGMTFPQILLIRESQLLRQTP